MDTKHDRPHYESEDDRIREEFICGQLEVIWNCELSKLPYAYRLDRTARRNETIVAFIEVKRRNRTFDEYPDAFLSLQKAMAARDLHLTLNVRCFYAVQFHDCLASADISTIGSRHVRLGGRVDRGDWQDQEPQVRVPMSEFKKLVEGKALCDEYLEYFRGGLERPTEQSAAVTIEAAAAAGREAGQKQAAGDAAARAVRTSV
jgi:hypothetical protein